MSRSLLIAATVAMTAASAQAQDGFPTPYLPVTIESFTAAPTPYIPMTAEAVARMKEIYLQRARLRAETNSRMICNYTSGPVTAEQVGSAQWLTPYLLVVDETVNPDC